MQVKKQQLEPDMTQWSIWFKIGKGVCQDCLLSTCLFICRLREGDENPLQYSYLENSMDGRVLQATVHGVTKSRTQNAGLDDAQAGIKIARGKYQQAQIRMQIPA